jgi:hypothetical protein
LIFVEFSRGQQVDVVGHPHVGVNAQTVLERGLDQVIAEELIVRPGSKDRLAVIAALDDVLRLAGDDVAGKSAMGKGMEWWTDQKSRTN